MLNISFFNEKSSLTNIGTSGFEKIIKTCQLSDGSITDVSIYDTLGQEKFHALNEFYYKGADAIVLVYDISNRKSFEEIREYYCNKINEYCRNNIPIMLIGNKTDKEDEREVSPNEGVELATSQKYKFLETSCLKNENVSNAFETLIELSNLEYHKKASMNLGNKKKVLLKRPNIIKNDCC